ncbi:hypothetical protein FRC19_008754 [Serendipita sp. 401]|nr:hypothetical protein FRC19_008754 [Serendipita sp. 401]KAG9057135.1 hypothetical protein FS842_008517 [Serendipita sp. 407]
MAFDATGMSGQMRIAALSIAAFDIIRTIPSEYLFYKTTTRDKNALLAAVRYLGVAAMVANGALYFNGYSATSCRSVHLTPGIFHLLLSLVIQVVFFLRTLDIAKRCRTALSIMIFAMIISIPLEAISVGLNRQPIVFSTYLTNNGCQSHIPDGTFNTAPVFYLAHLVFDIFAITLSFYHLFRAGSKSDLLRRLLLNGVAFMCVDALVSLLTLLASIDIPGIVHIGSICSIVTGMLAAQHILFLANQPNLTFPSEFKHEIHALPQAVYKGSDANIFQSTGTLPRFATPSSKPSGGTPYSTGNSRARPSIEGSASVFHSCVGREALRYRNEGDVNMFRQSKTSLTMPLDEAKGPIPIDVRRLSQPQQPTRLSRSSFKLAAAQADDAEQSS